MSAYVSSPDEQNDRFGSGVAGSVLLHAAVFAGIIGWAIFSHLHNPSLGENSSQVGSIQASMVSAIPLPTKAPPVKDQVLTPDDVSKAAAPPPKEATLPPPKDTDVLIKAKTPPATKTAPVPTPAPPKHAQPVPDTPKANSGEQATQLPQSISQTTNGTATLTVQNRALGLRYAYYIRIVSSRITQNYNQEFPDPRASQDKSVTVLFDIDRNGTPTNLRMEAASGSPTLDSAGKRAIQEVDSFGPNPAGESIPIAFKFDYHHP